jgi:two-component system sensor histidine kinase KdpD
MIPGWSGGSCCRRGHPAAPRVVCPLQSRAPWASLARHGFGPLLVTGVTAGLAILRANRADVALVYLLVVLLASTTGGLWPGAVTSVAAALAFNYFFLPPVGTLTIANPTNWVVLSAFLLTATVSSQLVARARARSAQAERRAREARRLLELSERILSRTTSPLDTPGTLAALAEDCAAALAADEAAVHLWEPEAPPPLGALAGRGAWRRAVAAAWRILPPRPERIPGPDGRTLLILPLARRSAHPALLLATGGARMEEGLAPAVAGLGSLALERMFLLEQATDAEALRRSDALKSALLSGVSHQLRTPLAAIRVAATALQRSEVWQDAAGRTDLLRTVDEEAERLNRVIGNLLCMSRIEAGALTLERRPCAPEEVVWEALRLAGRRPHPDRLRLVLPEGLPAIDCDLGLAGIALANLVDNAFTHGGTSAPVEVGVRLAPHGRLLAIWVADRGPGVPAGEAARIFEPFYRGHPRRPRATVGTGLGLSIARALVEAHGGRLWVEARAHGGSRFTATWPVAEARGGVARDGGDAAGAVPGGP